MTIIFQYSYKDIYEKRFIYGTFNWEFRRAAKVKMAQLYQDFNSGCPCALPGFSRSVACSKLWQSQALACLS